MKKTLNFKCTDEEYIVENTNPNEKKEPFKIDKKTLISVQQEIIPIEYGNLSKPRKSLIFRGFFMPESS